MSSNTFLGSDARIASVVASFLYGMPGFVIERQIRVENRPERRQSRLSEHCVEAFNFRFFNLNPW